MAEDLPTGIKRYDSVLGVERDAFPGEIIPEEQKKTLNRLMDKAVAEYERVRGLVARTGKFSDEQLDLLSRMGAIYAEEQRKEYLDVIQGNPATIIKEALATTGGSSGTRTLERDLNRNIKRVKNDVEARLSLNDREVNNPSIAKAVDALFSQNSQGGARLRFSALMVDNETREKPDRDERALLLQTLGYLPGADRNAVQAFANQLRGKTQGPRTAGSNVYDIQSRRPELDGITVTFNLGTFGDINSIRLDGDAKAWTRIMQAELQGSDLARDV